MVCTVTGTIVDSTDTAIAGAVVSFVVAATGPRDSQTMMRKPVSVTADGSGGISIDLHAGDYTCVIQSGDYRDRFVIAVPDEASASLYETINETVTFAGIPVLNAIAQLGNAGAADKVLASLSGGAYEWRGIGILGATVSLTGATASITMDSTGGTVGVQRVTAINNADSYMLQTRSEVDNTLISVDYRMDRDANGASLHRLNIAGTTVLEVADGAATVTGDLTVTDGAVKVDDGSAAAPSLAFAVGGTSGFFRPTGHVLGISTAGAEVARFDAAGRFLLGVTSGTSLLEVHRDSASVATFNRNTTDGEILNLEKDGASVLSLRANGGSARILAGTGGGITLETNGGTTAVTIGADQVTAFAAPIDLKSYTVAGLPSGAAGNLIFVTNESGGAVPAFHDGTNWRRTTDRAIVS